MIGYDVLLIASGSLFTPGVYVCFFFEYEYGTQSSVVRGVGISPKKLCSAIIINVM